jgi:hypothetical protein
MLMENQEEAEEVVALHTAPVHMYRRAPSQSRAVPRSMVMQPTVVTEALEVLEAMPPSGAGMVETGAPAVEEGMHLPEECISAMET